MTACEKIARAEQLIHNNLSDLKTDVSKMLDNYDSLGYDTMICVVVAKKNADGTFSSNMVAGGSSFEEFKIENSFIKSLIVK